ncbi:unnamed protein product [Zymoseptoria tritici ST99CH_3D1]|uniref:Uncharacterized protein n=2 Tax=Zymoseptoria tritici TaxID=1047171 RepID=F9X318_ZYMTI|nr:uncharacterized protein MYCGRDRAFT_68653 [Zymoseptoria tritici IPO323]EGP90015.1 hypothetical protein MYCGRDRAFT_68653 [Zymoseptoria tritici IPO323]SMQ47848.1 unnamed protein product [Zymoseptoria tritici ST99CH_3D7]SMR47629.1 unnamed protein product [Zymoseptoria tritici ST99CH_3D1]
MAIDRRRAGAFSPLALCLVLVLFLASTASAAVLGIDFGTLNIKAALVKPGIPLDIVLTKDSKRKEVAAVAFKPNRDEKNNIITTPGTFPERAYGGDALSLQGRFPGEVYPNLKMLLGIQPGEDAAQIYQQRYPALQLKQDGKSGATAFKSSAFADDVNPFSVEELIGMELANIKRNAESMAGKDSVVGDAVITVPPFYTAEEKRALVKAANFAGLNVYALISDGLAVGLDYAKTRTFPDVTKDEKPEYHLVYDMGAGSTSATLLRFQAKSVKETRTSNKTVQEVTVLGTGWDRTLGGDAMNHVIMEDFVTKLVQKSGSTTEQQVRSNGRIMGRFFKEAERVRQILSANSETSSGFEEILPDVDLRTKLNRAEFEKMTSGFADRVEQPIKDALAMASLGIEDLTSVIVHGGAIRTPFAQSKLEGLVGAAKIRNSVNPDESAVFGAAFKAASLSPSFRVKEIRDSDVAGYPTSLTYIDKGKSVKQTLFKPTSPVGFGATTKQVTFKDKDDFSFGFVQTVGSVDRPISTFKSDNLTASVEELSSKHGCDKADITTKFSVRLSPLNGLPDVTGGSVSCEVDDSKSGSVGDSVKGWLGFGKKKDQEPLGDDTDGPVEEVEAATSASASTKSSSTSDAASSSKTPEAPKKRTETVNVRVSAAPDEGASSVTEQITDMFQRLKDFDASDKARYAREEAQNVLESYTYQVRDFLENSDYEAFSTKTMRAEIKKLLEQTREWMDSGDLTKATTETLKEKRLALKQLVEPIKTRRTESTSRPKLIKSLQKALDDTQKLILKVEGEAAKASSSFIKAVAEASSSASSVVSKATDAASDVDDLEEPDTASSTTEPPPAPTNPYANLDFTFVQETYDNISKWLRDNLKAQEKLKEHEEPVLSIKDLDSKVAEIKKVMKQLSAEAANARKPKPTQKPKPKPKPKAPKKDKSKPVEGEEAPSAAEAETPVGEAEQDGKKPVKGAESIEDMMDWLKKEKVEHEEL